jgi:hypothetical protein
MSDYDALEHFDLRQHGDNWEKTLWGFVEGEFPAYQTFWRRYVVPLTNRIDPAVGQSTPGWKRVRPEIGSGSNLEQMTMHHYSVFYYLARARRRICEDKPLPLPEDVFALLDACADNLAPRASGCLGFFGIIRKIYADFGKTGLTLPTKGDLCTDAVCPALQTIRKYRDTILHNPVLGRGADRDREFLPKREFLERVGNSWLAAETLKGEDVIDSRELYEQLYRGLTTFLETKWREIIGALDAVRELSKFKSTWKLGSFLPIKTQQFVSTSFPSASATTVDKVILGSFTASVTPRSLDPEK